MNNVFLSIGTNMGNREHNLKLAVQSLQNIENVSVKTVSSIYETAPVGYVNQPNFLNIAVFVQTPHSPFEMLDICQSIENELGRIRQIRWGPRVIDLDILLFNHENIEAENLIVPHPRMYERAFVLVPLIEIASEVSNEQLQKAKVELAKFDIESEGVKKWKTVNSVDEFLRLE